MLALSELAVSERCAIYNDLSHMNPRYLTPQRYDALFHEEEILYHKRNLILLSLYFDKIIICTDNLLAFTKYLTKDVVSSVVMSPWFMELVDQKIIVLAGWGSSLSADLMKNQSDYSALYRPELKEARYTEHLSKLSQRAAWVVREEGAGEREHINYLLPHVRRLEGIFESRDVGFLVDLIEETNATCGYVGTMEIFPFIDELYGENSERSDAFFHSYYKSWHEYCAAHYAPCVPIHTRRIPLPHATIALAPNESALAALYSPDIFQRYLTHRFDHQLVARLLAVEISQLMAIRNGDWARFKNKFHEHLHAASKICWIAYHPEAHRLLADDAVVDELIADVLRAGSKDSDLSALGNAIDLVLGLAFGATGMAPALTLFRKQLHKRFGGLVGRVMRPDLEPYLRKLNRVLQNEPEFALTLSA